MKLMKYSLLCAFMLSGASCFGMEQQEEKKENSVVEKLNFSKMKKTEHKNVLYHHENSGFSIEMTEVCLDSHDGERIATISYASLNNIPNSIRYLQRAVPIQTILGLIPGGREAITSYVMSLATSNETIRNSLPDIYRYMNQAFSLLNERNSIVYVSSLKVSEAYKNQGIGSRLGTYMFLQIIKQVPDALLCWVAVPLDGDHKKDDLYRFYRNLGATVTHDGLAWLDTNKYHESLKSWGIVPTQQQSKL